MLTKGMDQKPWNHKMKVRRVVMDKTQAEAAEALGVPVKTVQRWEKAANKPNVDNRFNIGQAYDIDPGDIFGEGWQNEEWNGGD